MAVASEVVQWPHCQGSAVVKYGTASNDKVRYRCQANARCGRTLLRTSTYPGCQPEVKQRILEMTLNGSGIRDSARGLGLGRVIKELKKSERPLAGEQSGGRGVSAGHHSCGDSPG